MLHLLLVFIVAFSCKYPRADPGQEPVVLWANFTSRRYKPSIPTDIAANITNEYQEYNEDNTDRTSETKNKYTDKENEILERKKQMDKSSKIMGLKPILKKDIRVHSTKPVQRVLHRLIIK